MSPSRRALFVTLAAVAAILAGAAAPASWDPGPGSFEIAIGDDVVVSGPVEVGSDAVQAVHGISGGVAVDAGLPGGVPVDDPLRVEVAVTGRVVTLGEVEVSLVLADGSREAVPVLGEDGPGAFVAVRRPPTDVGVVLGLLAAVIVLWVSEAVPLFVTGLLIPVVLTFAEVASARAALAPFFDPIIVLFFAGFLMAEAMRRVELDRLAAVAVVAGAGRSPASLFAAMVAISAFMSMWMSNTAAVAVLLPIAMAVTAPLVNLGYRKAIVLGIAYAATIGGVGSAIGTPANLLAIDFLGSVAGREITFLRWFAFGLPMVVFFLPVMAGYLWLVSSVSVDADRFADARRAAVEQRSGLERLDRRQWAVLAVFGAVFAGWLTQAWHGISPGIVALAGAVALFAVGLVEPEDLQRISWPTLLTFGGGLTLGVHMVETGASDWLVTRLGALADWPTLLAVTAVAAVTLGLTTVASNTGSAATLIPLAIPLAGLVGVSPVLLVGVVAIASSVDFALVIGTPPTMLAYSTELFTVREILRKGAVLDLVGIVMLIAAVVPFWQLTGIV